MRNFCSHLQQVIVAAIFLISCIDSVRAESDHDVARDIYNRTTIGIVGGTSLGTYTTFVEEMAGGFDDIYKKRSLADPLRVIPILGKGSIQNLYDLLYLRNVTFAFVQEDVLTELAEYDARLHRFEAAREAKDLDNLRYVRFFSEEIRVVVNNGKKARDRRDGLRITKPSELAGAIVGIGEQESGSWFTAQTLLDLWTDSDYTLNTKRSDDAVVELGAGAIDALVVVAAEPNSILQKVSDNKDVTMLELNPSREAKNLGLKTTDTEVEWQGVQYKTWSVNALLVAWTGWREVHPRCEGLRRFIEYFLKFTGDKPYRDESEKEKFHPKWFEFPSIQPSTSVGDIKPLSFEDPCTGG